MAGVPEGGGHGFGDQLKGGPQARKGGRFGENIPSKGTPVGRMGKHDPFGRRPFSLHHLAQHAPQQGSGEQSRGVGRISDEHRSSVAQSALDLAHHQGGVTGGPPLGGLAYQHGAIGPDEDHRRHREAAAP